MRRTSPLVVAGVYALAGSLWILGSDRVAAWLFRDAADLMVVQTLKGLLYVVSTALLVYLLARRAVADARRAAEAENLAALGRLHDRVLATVGDPVFVVDRRTSTILQANRAAGRLFRCERADLVGLPFAELEDEAGDGGSGDEETDARLDAGRIVHRRARMRARDGAVLETEQALSLTDQLPGGEPGIVVSVHDVTDAVRSLADLALSQDRLRTLVETIPDLVWLKDAEGRYLAANALFENFIGVTVDDLLGRTDFDFFPPDLAGFFRENDRLAVEAGGPRINEEWLDFALTGYRGLFETIKTPMRTRDGELIGVLGIARDVTARHEAERRLRGSQDFLRETGSIARVAGWELPADAESLTWTDTAGEILGPGPDGAWSLADLVAAAAPAARDGIRAAFAAARNEGRPFDLEFGLVTPDERRLTVHLRGRPAASELGGEVGLRGVLQDITERHELEAQLLQAQKMESVGRLAGGLAHDYNNMLSIVLGHAEMALEDLPAESPLRSNIQQILHAGRRSADITRQLLGFARKQTIVPRALDLNETVGRMLQMLERMLREDIELEWRPAPGPCPVRMDPAQVDQIVINLVVNARDAIAGAGRITIVTEPFTPDREFRDRHPDVAPGEYVLLGVADDGAGVPAAVRDRIFDPFFTTKSQAEGTGLGLPMIFGIVQQNGGFIDFDSAEGAGTSFRILLPRETFVADAPPEPAPAADRSTAEAGTVLLVEDEAPLLAMAVRILEKLGYRVLPAADAEAALDIAGRYDGKIDLLMSDMVMPGMSGRELWRNVQEIRPGLACLFVSGHAADIIGEGGRLAPGTHFLQKPYTIDRLAHALREALEG